MKLDVRGRPGEAEAGGEEGDAVQHWLAGACACSVLIGLALGVCGRSFVLDREKFD